MSAPTRDDYKQRGRAAALAGEARPKKHAGSWQREAFLEGYDAVVSAEKATRPKKSVTPPEGSVPPLQKYCHAIRNRLQHLGWSQWNTAARSHVLSLTDQMEKEHNEKRANRLHRKILSMMLKHGIQQEKPLAV